MIKDIENYIKVRASNLGDVEKITPLKSHINEVYLVKMSNGKDLIFKIIKNTKGFNKTILLNKILRNSGIPIPKILHKRKNPSEFSYPIIIEKKLKGAKISPTKYSNKVLKSLAFNLFLLHSINYKFFTNFYGKNYGNILKFAKMLYVRDLEKIRSQKIFNKNFLDNLEIKLGELLKLLDKKAIPAIVHNDIYPDNLLIENEEITGILDWENTLVFDYRMDFVKIFWWMFHSNKKEFNKFLNYYAKFKKIDKNFKEIFIFYQLITLIGYINFSKESKQRKLYFFAKRKLERIIKEDLAKK